MIVVYPIGRCQDNLVFYPHWQLHPGFKWENIGKRLQVGKVGIHRLPLKRIWVYIRSFACYLPQGLAEWTIVCFAKIDPISFEPLVSELAPPFE